MSQALWRSLGFCQICAPIQQSTRINPQFHLDNSGVLWRRAINIANRYNSSRLWGVVRLACNAPKACINRLGAQRYGACGFGRSWARPLTATVPMAGAVVVNARLSQPISIRSPTWKPSSSPPVLLLWQKWAIKPSCSLWCLPHAFVNLGRLFWVFLLPRW